jgi:hypothetical protein
VPKQFLSKLNLTVFETEYGKYLGIIFVVSSSFLLVVLVTTVTNIIYRKRYRKRLTKEIIGNLNELDPYEQAILREFMLFGKYSLQLPFNDESVISLQHKSILIQQNSTFIGNPLNLRFCYAISDIAQKHLKPEMIGLPNRENLTKKEEQWLVGNRPHWNKQDRY